MSPKHAHVKSQFWEIKNNLLHHHNSFRLHAIADLEWMKNKHSLGKKKPKASGSDIEVPRKERLRIRRENKKP